MTGYKTLLCFMTFLADSRYNFTEWVLYGKVVVVQIVIAQC